MATSYYTPGNQNVLTLSGTTSSLILPVNIPDGFLLILTAEWSYNAQTGGGNPDGTDVGLTIVDNTGANNDWQANLRQNFDGSVTPHGINSCVTWITSKGFAGSGKSVTMTFAADMHVGWQVHWLLYGDFQLDQLAVGQVTTGSDGVATSPTVTPAWDGALLFCYMAMHAHGTDSVTAGSTPGAGFTSIYGDATAAVEIACQATAAPVNASFTTDVGARATLWLLAFRPYGWVQSGNWPGGGNAVIGSGTSVAQTLPQGAVSTSHAVVIGFGWAGAGVDDASVNFTDNATGVTNTYTVSPRIVNAGGGWGVAYCADVRGHPTTFTMHTTTAHNMAFCAFEFGGRWRFNSLASNSNTSGTFPAGTVTPVRDGGLIVSVLANTAAGSGTSDLYQHSLDNVLVVAAKLQGAAAAITPHWTVTGGSPSDMFALAFTPYVNLAVQALLVGGGAFAPPQLNMLAHIGAAFSGGGAFYGSGDYRGGIRENISAQFAGAGALTVWVDWQGSDQINVGIDEIAGEELLYRNASGLEKAMADVDAYRLTVTYAELVRDQWDPYAISSRNLGYLAWAQGVNLWEDDWSEEFKRYWTANQWTFKYYRGSDLGLKMAVEAVDAKIVRLTRPPASFFPGRALTTAERQAYVQRFPQLRLYPYAPRPQLPWLNYLGGVTYKGGPPHYVNNGRFFGPLRKFYPTNYNAGGAYLRACTVFDPLTGVETQCTARTVIGIPTPGQKVITYDEITLPLGKDNHFYPGSGNKQYLFPPKKYPLNVKRFHSVVLGVIDSTPSRMVRVPRDGSLQNTQFQAIFTTIVPSLQPLSVRPETVSTPHPIRKTEFYCGQPLVNKFLPKSNAWQFLYERWYLFDPTRNPTFSPGNVYMGRSRFGIKKYSAEAKIAAYWNWPRRSAYYGGYMGPGYFFAPANTKRIEQLQRAVVASMAARDTIAINTRVKRPIQIRDVTLLDGRFSVGQWITDSS